MIIGIDLGGMSAKAACLHGTELLGRARVGTSAGDSFEKTARALGALCRESAEAAGVPFEEVRAVGIGSPGVIDSATGTVVNWSNFGWKDVPLAELVSRETGKRVFVTNDANAAALGEAVYGAGKHFRDSVLVTLGTGVGGGIVLGGKLFEGFRSAGAELGHTVIRKGGALCSCGRKGCFEMYASTRALLARTRKGMAAHPESAMWRIAPSRKLVDGKTVFEALRLGDPAAKEVFDGYIADLGEGICNIVNLLRPQAIILGGGISAEGDALLVPLKKYVFERMYVSAGYAPLEIVAAQLQNDAGLYGAAEYAVNKMGE